MNNEKIEIGGRGRVLVVDAMTASEIRQRIIARLKRDAEISAELRQGNHLPAGHRNQTARWSNGNYSRNQTIDGRAINSVIRGMVSVIERRYQETLKRDWTA